MKFHAFRLCQYLKLAAERQNLMQPLITSRIGALVNGNGLISGEVYKYIFINLRIRLVCKHNLQMQLAHQDYEYENQRGQID